VIEAIGQPKSPRRSPLGGDLATVELVEPVAFDYDHDGIEPVAVLFMYATDRSSPIFHDIPSHHRSMYNNLGQQREGEKKKKNKWLGTTAARIRLKPYAIRNDFAFSTISGPWLTARDARC